MTAPTWSRSDLAGEGLGRALVADHGGHHACLSRFDALWVLSDHRQLGRIIRPVGLERALREGAWSMPTPDDLSWLQGGG